MKPSSIRTNILGKSAVLFLALLVAPEFAFAHHQTQDQEKTTPAAPTKTKPAPAQHPVSPAKPATPTNNVPPKPGTGNAGPIGKSGGGRGSAGPTDRPTVSAPIHVEHLGDGGTHEIRGDGSSVDRDRSGQIRSITTASHASATFDGRGKVKSIDFKSPNGYDTKIIHHPSGAPTVVSEHVNGRGEQIRIVNTGRNSGYVDHTIIRNGNPYLRRTYVVNGRASVVMYRGYSYRGRIYYGYVPRYYYGPAFYGWAYDPWGAPVAFAWGWGAAPWYGYYGYYFAPYPVYAGPAFWLTDYIVAQDLQAAYDAGAASTPQNSADQAPPLGDGNSGQNVVTIPGNQAWTATGTFVNAGDEITINATGGVAFSAGSAPQSPAGDPQSCLTAASGPNGWRASPFPDVHLRCWSLIGKIGESGRAFYVGENRDLRSTSSGQLYLGVNDNVLGDNSGYFVATITVPSSGPTGVSQSSPDSRLNQGSELTPQVKAAIADEVKTQISTEQATSTTATNAPSVGDQVPAALDAKQRTFIVSTALAAQTTDGTQCSLSPGDILTRVTDIPDANQKVTALVTSSQKNDCASGSMLSVSVQDLQDMHNDFVQKMDAGLQNLATDQGKNGMPASPNAGGRPNPDAQAVPDQTAASDLQQQQQAADGAEQDVNHATGTGQGN